MQSITLGSGADVFRHEPLREGFAVVPLDSETAMSNETHLLDSNGKSFDVLLKS